MCKVVVFVLTASLFACGTQKSVNEVLAQTDSSPAALQALESSSLRILTSRCTSCHNSTSPAGVLGQADDKVLLLAEGYIVPGDHVNSLVDQVITQDHGSQAVTLSAEEKETIRTWIDVALRSLTLPALGLNSTRAVLQGNCTSCHGVAGGNTAGVNLEGYSTIKRYLTFGQPSSSRLFDAPLTGKMPPGNAQKLDTRQLAVIYNWILSGAAESGVR